MGPEFQLGQVYDGGTTNSEADVVLYRPVYVCVSSLRSHLKTGNNFAANCAKLTQQNSKDRGTPIAAITNVPPLSPPTTATAISTVGMTGATTSGGNSVTSQDS